MPRKGNLNWYDQMPADYGDNDEVKPFVGIPVVPEPVEDDRPVLFPALAEDDKPPVKRGRPAKKVAQKAEDEQGTTAKD